ncbi:1-acyl-sn-glycerol-3-phosphate acyltransferase [Streptomyces sp. 3MP-14]|uniref:1-acyl-sn-glycerol-3-phosphate acyltransferase n=1 Tax=Streptomyces mimosae TaxID=2586635 RepID=A0A5N5ZQ48_9ACTN|nr:MULTISPECIES: lysophospholipid acyltransferase family protein [Streptomyces]KAB8157846.1 1-acyl-sn-glycerol-3-phosphate acyltransferase [Streptomyces mimosae]KAB8172325.1 1-acyl-sn-glycerol-3-phosphate acyltransferase [Streptomyces sp. 3MP-14]
MTPPGARGAVAGHRLARGVIHTAWRPRVLGAWRTPPAGPLILAVNHTHNVDGPVLLGTAPRPVRFLIKREAFVGPLGPFLRGIGQIGVDREATDLAAVRAANGVLERGEVLGIFPEGTRGRGDFAAVRAGLAYFALRSGAPVQPVAVLGGDRPGRLLRPLPPLRSRVDVVFGEPFTLEGAGGSRRGRAALDRASAELQARLADHVRRARRATDR